MKIPDKDNGGHTWAQPKSDLHGYCVSFRIKFENVRLFAIGLPELKVEDFANNIKNISEYSWIHFEGRPNIEEIKKMLEFIHENCENRPKISLEMEKLNRNYDPLLPLVDVIFVSKEYALSKGFQNKSELVKGYHTNLKCLVICAWGDQGASGRDLNGQIVEIPAYKPPSGIKHKVA